MSDEKTLTVDKDALEGADSNSDGHVSKDELALHLEYKRKELEEKTSIIKIPNTERLIIQNY